MQKSVTAFETRLGWIALAADAETVFQLTLAHSTRDEAIAAIRSEWAAELRPTEACGTLVERIYDYVLGRPDTFQDVSVDTGYLTPLGRRVFDRCRCIPHGQTRTYGEVAAEAGHARAARAVGQFLASNRTPILVPCHRVVAAGGRLGGFTAPGGVLLKRRLLQIEMGEFNLSGP
ncbi:MAG: methylated-DNA--[protein]-cysteine S-methyltransferase [Pirellulales bacterium]|nr:methylated-DNA--[protein]-cysteine S-methyltransferase [Pirellulales bacterium]